MTKEKTKIRLKDLKNNPYHSGKFDKEQIKKLETSIRNLGILRSFSVFKKGKEYFLVCGHHTREAAIKVLGKEKEVEVTVQPYDSDTAVWGMAIENITQSDKIRQIDDLVAVRNYLKKNFKDYKAFAEFMKKKGMGVGIPDSHEDKRPYKDSFRKKTEQNYPQVGSVRQISEWLNRKGIIMEFQEISELLRLKDNLSPDLYKKMVVGQTNRPNEEDEDEETAFNLSNAKMLASLGPDHKEQKEVLTALENSLGERMHRVRTRGKVLTRYKELKKAVETGKIKIKDQEININERDKKKIQESIDLIRKGKKDIGNIDLPNIKLPPEITEITMQEYNSDLRDKFRILGNEMESFCKQKLSQNSVEQLEQWLMYLESWGNNKFAEFFKAIMKETAKKKLDGKKEEKIIEFRFNSTLKGGEEK